MAKKIPKIPSKMSWIDKLLVGIGAGSPVIGRDRLYQSMSGATESGKAAKAAQRAKLIAKYGKGAMRMGRIAGLLNPWTAVPVGLLSLADFIVGRGMEPYMNQDVENTGLFFDNRGISEEGSARMVQERLAREELTRANAAKRGEVAWMDDPDFRMWGNEGGIARLL